MNRQIERQALAAGTGERGSWAPPAPAGKRQRCGVMSVDRVRVFVLSAIVCLVAGRATGRSDDEDSLPTKEWPAHGLRDVASVFPKSQLISSDDAKYLTEPVGQVLAAVAREDGGAKSQIAFVLDRSFPYSFGSSLEIALAENRENAPAGNYALITCGHDDRGVWSAHIEVPLKPDVYSVLRAPGHLRWNLNYTAIPATWAGLAKATELEWNPAGPSPHVIVLTDDRSESAYKGLPANGDPTDPAVRKRVMSWAQARHATLHVIRLTPEPFPEPHYEGQQNPGMDMKTLAGLFRNQEYVRASSDIDLRHAIEMTIARAGADAGPSDLVIVDDQRRGLDGRRGALSSVEPSFQRFCATPGHRLALVRWGNAIKPLVEFDFTTDAAKMTRAAARPRGTPRSTGQNPLFDALDRARGLVWAPKARKAILVFSGPYLERSTASRDSILDWAGNNDVAVTIVGP